MVLRILVAAGVAFILFVDSARDAHAADGLCGSSSEGFLDPCVAAVGVVAIADMVAALWVGIRNIVYVAKHRRPGPFWLVAGYVLGTAGAVALVWGIAAPDRGTREVAFFFAGLNLSTLGATIWGNTMPVDPFAF